MSNESESEGTLIGGEDTFPEDAQSAVGRLAEIVGAEAAEAFFEEQEEARRVSRLYMRQKYPQHQGLLFRRLGMAIRSEID